MPSDHHGNMTALFERFDLDREITTVRQQKFSSSGISSRTLFKNADLRIVLLALRAGAEMLEHHTDGTISVQVLSGTIQFNTQGKTHDLAGGHLLTLGPSIPHSVRAVEDAIFLLTLAWPRDPELRSLPHRGYGT